MDAPANRGDRSNIDLWSGHGAPGSETALLAENPNPNMDRKSSPRWSLKRKSVLTRNELLSNSTAASERENQDKKAAGPRFAPLRYQILATIAQGGVGLILRGFDDLLKREVAVKIVRPERLDSPRTLRRFHHEAEINARMQHPGVVPVYERGCSSDLGPYFAMKLVTGRTLGELLRERVESNYDLPRFLGIFEQVAQTLAYAHANGVIHRDLKPDNIMVGEFGEVQVMDWGFAKAFDGSGGDSSGAFAAAVPRNEGDAFSGGSKSGNSSVNWSGSNSNSGGFGSRDDIMVSLAGSIVGTPHYMAPEQARGEVHLLDPRTDVFGLGAILCEILLGRPPYLGTSQFALIQAKSARLDAIFEMLDQSHIDPELGALTKACLCQRPEGRPPDARAVADAIASHRLTVAERLRQAEMDRAVAVGKAEEERKRRRVASALVAVVALALLGAASLFVVYQQDRQARQAQLQTAVRAVEAAIAQAIQNPDSDLEVWTSVLKSAEQAEGLRQRAWSGDVGLEQQALRLLAEARRNANLVQRLEEIRVPKIDENNTMDSSYQRMAREYESAFRNWGLDVRSVDPKDAADWIARQQVSRRLLMALDDWAFLTRDQDLAAKLMSIARLADSNNRLNSWRNAYLNRDRDLLKREALAFRAEISAQDSGGLAAQALFLGHALGHLNELETSRELLRAAQRRFADKLWINFYLVEAFLREPKRPEEAARFLAATLAARPDFAQLHYYCGMVLNDCGRRDEAALAFHDAIRINPKFSYAHHELGRYHEDRREIAKAGEEYGLAIRYDKDLAVAQAGLGNVYFKQSKLVEALQCYQEALRKLEPHGGNAVIQSNMGITLYHLGRRSEAIKALREAIRLDPKVPKAHCKLGQCYLASGAMDYAKEAYRQALKVDPSDGLAHDGFGLCLSYENRIEEAVGHYRLAIRFTMLNTELRGLVTDRMEDIKLDEPKMSRLPGSVRLQLVEAYSHLGQGLRARGEYEPAVRGYQVARGLATPFAAAKAGVQDGLSTSERLERLSRRADVLLDGKEAVRDLSEKQDLAEICYARGHYGESARLFQEIFDVDPAKADDLGAGLRYNAACSAVLASAGKGQSRVNPAQPPSVEQMESWRALGVRWLAEALESWAKAPRTDSNLMWSRRIVMHHWMVDLDLAAIRDLEAIERLPESQRQHLKVFWKQVADLAKNPQSPEGPRIP